MLVRFRLSALKEGRWRETILRFVLGGLATVATGLVADIWGPVTGGLFLALPAIFCASVTLIEKHERERKEKKGMKGARRGRSAAALDAAGGALGGVALAAFGGIVWVCAQKIGAWSLAPATIVWFAVAALLWLGRRHMRLAGKQALERGRQRHLN